MHLALVVRVEARSTADISGSRAMSPTSRLTLAATDVCEDPAQQRPWRVAGRPLMARARLPRASGSPPAGPAVFVCPADSAMLCSG
jgi:hypothetical protein